MKRALLVIAKRPQPGKTKTRLTPLLSPEQAAQLYECFLLDTLDLARAVPGVNRFILYTPVNEAAYFAQLAPDFRLLGQHGQTLGERLDNALTDCLNNGFDQVAIINSDGPTLPAAHISQTFTLLEAAEAVFGPSEDGGYYLIGLTRSQSRLLREVKMSTPTVLKDTLRLAKEEAVRVSLLPKWYDVDTFTDLQRLIRELETLPDGVAVNTRQVLNDYLLNTQSKSVRKGTNHVRINRCPQS